MATGKKSGDVVVAGHHLVGLFGLLVVMLGIAFTLGYLLGRNQYDTRLRSASSTAPEPGDPPRKPKPASASSSSNAASSLNSASRAKKTGVTPPLLPPADWDFYHSGEPAKPNERLEDKSALEPPVKQTPKALSNPAFDPVAQPRDSKSREEGQPKPAPAATHPGATLVAKPAARGSIAVSKGAPSRLPVSAPTVSKLIPRGATVLQVAAVVRQADALALAQALQKKKFPVFVVTPDTDRFYRVQVGPYRDAQAANTARKRLEEQGFKTITKR